MEPKFGLYACSNTNPGGHFIFYLILSSHDVKLASPGNGPTEMLLNTFCFPTTLLVAVVMRKVMLVWTIFVCEHIRYFLFFKGHTNPETIYLFSSSAM